MNSSEKCEMLKSTIYQLYVNEGRSKSYISRLLDVNRETLGDKINHEWDFPVPNKVHYAKPHNVKFLNQNKELILSKLNTELSITDIAKELKVTRDRLMYIIEMDDDLKTAWKEHSDRVHQRASKKREEQMESSRLNYSYTDLPGEEWKEILGYSSYEVSNMGRIRSYAARYKSYYLLRPHTNKFKRVYVILTNDDGEAKNLILARVVAHTFVEGHSIEKDTVNHIDGNTENNKASNLEWVSQSENNKHAYSRLNRTVSRKRRDYEKVIYDGKYEFKTNKALARFLNISDAQVSRYLDNPERHNLVIVPRINCND